MASRTIFEAVASLIASGGAKNIVFLTGAGVSVAAGIPDFRSPGGMYDTLRPDLLTATEAERKMMRHNPTAVVSRDLFEANQFPYMEVRRPFIVGTAEGRWRPTLSHLFMRLVHDKGLLRRVYTQNIDGLDYPLDIPREKLVPVHGNMGIVKCEFCGDDPEGGIKWFAEQVQKHIKNIYDPTGSGPKESTNIPCRRCGANGLKPATVMYGASMPTEFFTSTKEDFEKAEADNRVDLMFVMGTSLGVYPAASIPDMAPSGCVKVLVNMEEVGQFDKEHLALGNCDDQALKFIQALGWLPDAEKYADQLCESSAESLRKALEIQRIQADTDL